MKLQASETDFPLVPDGLHIAQIKDITEETGGKYGPYLKWHFAVQGSGQTVAGVSPIRMGPESKTRQWAERVLNRKIADWDVIDTDELIGAWVQIGVSHSVQGDKTFNTVESLFALQGQGAPVQTTERVQKPQVERPLQTEYQRANVPASVPDLSEQYAPAPSLEQEFDAMNVAPSPTFAARLNAAIKTLGFVGNQAAQASTEFRRVITGDAFSTEPKELPKFADMSPADQMRVVMHFETLAKGEIDPADIPF